jgi:hypothetical protein
VESRRREGENSSGPDGTTTTLPLSSLPTSPSDDPYLRLLSEETLRWQESGEIDWTSGFGAGSGRMHDEEGGEEDEHDREHESDEDVPSLLFGGSASSLDGISLWSLFWRGIDVDLNSWNVDISHLNYTFSTPSEQSQQRIAYQKLFRAAAQPTTATTTPAADATKMDAAHAGMEAATSQQTDGTAHLGATNSPSEALEAAQAALAANIPGLDGVHGVRPPRAISPPQMSVLHDLKPQQGIAPFVTFSPDCSQVQLALVHAYYDTGAAEQHDPMKDSRGDGLIEWFTRPATPLLYPIATAVAPPRAPLPDASSEEDKSHTPGGLPFDPEFAFTYFLGLSPETLLSGFPSDLPRSGAQTRRRLIDGDWILSEWARVPGMVHAQATSNPAGNCGLQQTERDWLVVAYEEISESPSSGQDLTQTKLHIFFQPSPDAVQMSDALAGGKHPSRTSIVVPLGTLRSVTALHVLSSTVSAPDADSRADATIFYSLRGDRRVFRSILVSAAKHHQQDASEAQWKMEYRTGPTGPLATRRGFISQTVALQTYTGETAHLNATMIPPAESNALPYKVIASELNWARGPVILSGPLAAGTVNRWQSKPSSSSFNRDRHKKQLAPQLQPTPPFQAAIYEDAAAASTGAVEGLEVESSFRQQSWITSTKTLGQYGADVYPLSIHRGTEGTLSPLVTTASSNRQFVAFAQVPLITTVDGNINFEPIEIVHLDADTVFTGLAFNSEGTILAVADNHGDIIILHREKKAAEAYKYAKQSSTETAATSGAGTAAVPMEGDAPETQSSEAPTAPSEVPAEAAGSRTGDVFAPSEEASSPESKETIRQKLERLTAAASSAASPSPPPSKPARKRHAWEVLMEVILPQRIKQLPLMSVQIIDVPVTGGPASDHSATPTSVSPIETATDAASSSSTSNPAASPSTASAATGNQTTPFLIMLFQGGVMGAMQLKSQSSIASCMHGVEGCLDSGAYFSCSRVCFFSSCRLVDRRC